MSTLVVPTWYPLSIEEYLENANAKREDLIKIVVVCVADERPPFSGDVPITYDKLEAKLLLSRLQITQLPVLIVGDKWTPLSLDVSYFSKNNRTVAEGMVAYEEFKLFEVAVW